jgi:Aldehyde dehydrogenase family
MEEVRRERHVGGLGDQVWLAVVQRLQLCELVSELLVRDHRVDKIAFTGSTAAGRRIASICGERIARCTRELGGKSAAVMVDDKDIPTAAQAIAGAECFLSGQVCSSLTHNAFRTDFGIAFGGFKRSGIGREGGIEGLRNYLEVLPRGQDGHPGGPPGRLRGLGGLAPLSSATPALALVRGGRGAMACHRC